VRDLLSRKPSYFKLDVDHLEHSLTELKALGPIDQATINKILTTSMRVLQAPPEVLASKLAEMSTLFGSTPTEVLRVCTNALDVIWLPTDRMRDRYGFLQQALGADAATVFRRIIRAHPRSLTYQSAAITQKCAKFATIVSSTEKARSLVLRTPAILTPSAASVDQRISFLRDTLHATDEEVGGLIYKTPIVLSCSIEFNLEPKIQFLTERAQLSRATIIDNPVLLTLSLNGRIRPRVEAALSKKHLLTPSLLKSTELTFLTSIDMSKAKFKEFMPTATQLREQKRSAAAAKKKGEKVSTDADSREETKEEA
jgi:hypothetical protein